MVPDSIGGLKVTFGRRGADLGAFLLRWNSSYSGMDM